MTAIDHIITPWIELEIRSINASSGRDATSVTANSEHRERIGITASFKNVSEKNNTFHELNANDDARKLIPSEVSDLSVPRTHFDRQHALITKAYENRSSFEENVITFFQTT